MSSNVMVEEPVGSDPNVGAPAHAKLEAMLRGVIRATGCAAAMVCLEVENELVVVAASHGGQLSNILPFYQPSRTSPREGLKIELVGNLTGNSIGFEGANSGMLGFAAIAPAPGGKAAYLIALDERRDRALSRAQIYTLRAHAAHLATIVAMVRPRENIDGSVGSDNNAGVERLRLLESVAIHARDSIIITEAEPIDLPGPRILYCNAAFTKATGYTSEEVIGMTPRILQGPDTDRASRDRLRAALAAWEPVEIELINYRKDGSQFWVELSIVPVADERGWFTHWVSVQRDITERKDAEELAIRVRVAEGQNEALAAEIVERKRIEAKLFYTAFHDGLTRLRNRNFFMDRLTKALRSDCTGQQRSCAVLFLDLDQFKVVNDSLGHAEGDALLIDIAQRLSRCIRPQDTLARIGGDEFAILVENQEDLSQAVHIAERIIEELRSPIQLSCQAVFPSCSIGIVQSINGMSQPEDLMRDADIAMYEAKRAGYGDYAIFDISMHETAVARLTLQTDLRRSLERSEFTVVYQPVIDPTTMDIVSFEALLRWHHPTRGPVPPADFIPVAEEIGVIREIDRFVMREACAQLGRWHALLGKKTLRMSVNISTAELVDPAFLHDLAEALNDFGVPHHCLEIEITEGIFLHPSSNVASVLAAVRESGVRIALDDFGTGYSSLSYINRYAIDTIKIDKVFIDGVCTNASTRAIVELILKLGIALDLRIIAEGVETQVQVDALVGIGCTAIQGFFFSKPLLATDATLLLAPVQRKRHPGLVPGSAAPQARRVDDGEDARSSPA